MRCVVTLVFGRQRRLELPVDVHFSDMASRHARDWLEEQWVQLGCEPTRASGKVLLLDKILSVTEMLGYDQLSSDAAKADELACQVALALEKPHITIDLQDQTVGF